jgi:hypothetical protein
MLTVDALPPNAGEVLKVGALETVVVAVAVA